MVNEFLNYLADLIGLDEKGKLGHSAGPPELHGASSYLRGPNEDVNQVAPNAGVDQVPLPSHLAGRPGAEKYAYALGHLHDMDQGNEDHSADVEGIPWSATMHTMDPQSQANIAGVLAKEQRDARAMGPPASLKDPNAISNMLASKDPGGYATKMTVAGRPLYQTGYLGSRHLTEQDALDYLDLLAGK